MVLQLLVFGTIFLSLLFLVSQVAVPAYHNRRLFPSFRRDRRKALTNLQEAKGRVLVAEDVLEAAKEDATAAELSGEAELHIESAYDNAMDRQAAARDKQES